MAKGGNGVLTLDSVQDAVDHMDKPRIDLDELSWGDTKLAATLGARFNKMQTETDAEAVGALLEQLERVVAPIIVSIPRSWLVKRAPESWGVTQPGALNWLKRSRMIELINLVVAGAEAAEDTAKN